MKIKTSQPPINHKAKEAQEHEDRLALATMRFKKQVCVAMTFLSICSCAGRFEMKKDHFASDDGQQKYHTAFRIKFNYEEKNTSANPISGCRFHFSGDGLYNIPVIGFKTSERSYEYKVKQDYVFVEGDSGDIYLSAINSKTIPVQSSPATKLQLPTNSADLKPTKPEAKS